MRLVIALWCLVPAPALACAVCFDATDQNRQAFIDTTILLTGLPLLLVGSGAYWLYRQYQTAAT